MESIVNQIMSNCPFCTLKEIKGIIKKKFANVDINSYAMITNIIINDKFDIYSKNNNDRKASLYEYTNQISSAVGEDKSGEILIPLNIAYTTINVIQSFLQNIIFHSNTT